MVDASQGVEAQTLANAYLAISNGLEIIPIINKIDLPSADIERTKAMIEKSVGLPAGDAVAVSAKTGLNVADILEAVVMLLPPPQGDAEAPLQALIFDSWFDPVQRGHRSCSHHQWAAAQRRPHQDHVERAAV